MAGQLSPEAFQLLWDRAALQDLVMTYCRASDRRDFELMRSLYHDDAIDDHGAMFSGPVNAFMDWIPTVMAQFEATSHSVTNALFAISGDQANGEIYAVAYHRTFAPNAQEIIVNGRYLDRYERRDGQWKFVYRSLAMDACQIRAVDAEAYEHFTAGAALGRPDAGDPSYSVLPMFGRGLG